MLFLCLRKHWSVDANAKSGYLPWANRQEETSCYQGRGENYSGNAATTINGYACEAGTFCRNEDGGTYLTYCLGLLL